MADVDGLSRSKRCLRLGFLVEERLMAGFIVSMRHRCDRIRVCNSKQTVTDAIGV